MKILEAIKKGVLAALQFYVFMLIGILPLNVILDYFEGDDIGQYASMGFVLNFINHPLIYGSLFCIVVVSVINQFVLLKKKI
ncbi:hypothetical protein [Thalassotalea litorea]|uniref:hypothetical protein n=1 Tax=Thalassotalea litorea TaxID=2020715 RepID=UPI003735BB3B